MAIAAITPITAVRRVLLARATAVLSGVGRFPRWEWGAAAGWVPVEGGDAFAPSGPPVPTSAPVATFVATPAGVEFEMPMMWALAILNSSVLMAPLT
jgi:hypothetical protein